MSHPAYQVRRATVEDLPKLVALWEAMHFAPIELERRLTDFQVAVTGDGELLGAVALEVAGRSGRIHSEGFTDFALADDLRHLLWERMQSVATNHGLSRLWTQETAPFWNRSGFRPPEEGLLKKLPEQWASAQSGWLTLKLREEEALQLSLEVEFARFKEEEQRRLQGTLRRTRAMKFAVTLLAVVMAIFVIVICAYVFVHRNALHRAGH